MGQSIAKNYLHLVWSTKHRTPLIHEPFESELHAYLGSICKNLHCPALTVGGYTDHVHILCQFGKEITLARLMYELKAQSSRWAKTQGMDLENFYWQDGYGSFSVNPSQVDVVTAYIANQHQHHQKKSFQEEYRSILKKYNVDFDERYVWD